MRGNRFRPVAALCACVLTLLAPSGAIAQTNCPKLSDQLVLVTTAQPVAFQLDVTDLGTGTVSVFQYPLGGILEQVGPLEFVFVPQLDFRGTTQLTYRVTTPVGCPQASLLGRVTLAGGNAGSLEEENATTAIGLVEPPKEPDLFELVAVGIVSSACGLGFAPMSVVTFAMLVAGGRWRRRPRRSD